MDRRDFIKVSGVAAAGLALTGCAPKTGSWSKKEQELYGAKKKGHFSLMQISSATDTIGESYLMNQTDMGISITETATCLREEMKPKEIIAREGDSVADKATLTLEITSCGINPRRKRRIVGYAFARL